MASSCAFVYIVRCSDGTFYTGYAVDLERRLRAHNLGRGARYTSGRRPVSLIYAVACTSKSEALKRERQIKRWSRAKKAELARLGPDIRHATSARTRRRAAR